MSRLSRSFPLVRAALILGLVMALTCAVNFPVQARSIDGTDSALDAFIASVVNGDAAALRGVYVQGVLSFAVVQQPDGMAEFVSAQPNELTQFSMAARAGSVGLLAHNFLAGQTFSALAPGAVVVLVYGDGSTRYYLVNAVLRYQALEPNNPYSAFVDLDSQSTISAAALFEDVYGGSPHVTFQTCIADNGELSWGRLFVIAQPMPDPLYSYSEHMRDN